MWLLVAVASGIVSGVWLVLLWEQRRMRRDGLELAPEPPSANGDQGPSVCVVVPVRNAASALKQCVATLLAQDCPNLSVLIVDDRSEDDTRQVAQELERRHERVSSLRIEQLPVGWLGKSHALWRGAQACATEWMLFVDDDCTLHPAAVRTALAEARRRDVGLLSLWPRHDGRTFWENMLIPLCGGIIAMWFARAQGRGAGGFANGQFILVSRESYRALGGHHAVRDALIEDVAFAEHAQAAGVASFVGSGTNLFAVRMYDGFRSVFDGWSRIFVGALHNSFKMLVSIVWLLVGSLLPYVALPALLWLWWRRGQLDRGQIIALGVTIQHLVLLVNVSYRFWGMGRCDRRYLWGYPLSVMVVVGMLVRATYVLTLGRRVRWRATTYAIDGRARIASVE